MRQAWQQGLSIGMVAFFMAVPVWAQGNIVDTAHVEQALTRGAIVWDAREAADYAEGHIPGAVNFGWVGKCSGTRTARTCRRCRRRRRSLARQALTP